MNDWQLSSTGSTPSGQRPDAPRHAISVDVEDWFQVWALTPVIDRAQWDEFPLRVQDRTRHLMDMFDANGATATFFVLGWVAERCPDLIAEMAARGHEVASHGWDHTKVFDQDEDAFRADVTRTKALLEELSGAPVTGFRAAGFSIDSRTPFAHRVLKETGHLYSSSSHPIAHDHYGDATAPLDPHVIDGLLEIPVAVTHRFGRRQSCAGGGWFRVMPYAISKSAWRDLSHAGRRGVFYFHPWEIDPEQPRVSGLPLKSLLRHRINLGRMEGKIGRLLKDFNWGRIDHLFAGDIAAANAAAGQSASSSAA